MSAQSLTGGKPVTSCPTYTAKESCINAQLCEWSEGEQKCQPKLINDYKAVFRNLIVIQGLFAGLSVGKMSEGAIIAGAKHSLFMMFVGVIAFLVVG
jgi:hypothetical protein